MVSQRNKWRQYQKALGGLGALVVGLLLLYGPALAIHFAPGGGGGDVSGSGSGAVSWANWTERGEPGGTTAFVLQFENPTLNGGELGYGFDSSAEVPLSFVTAYGASGNFRSVTRNSYFTIPLNVINSLVVAKENWTFIACVSGFQYSQPPVGSPESLLFGLGAPSIILAPNNQVSGGVSGWYMGLNGGGITSAVTVFVTTPPPKVGQVYLYAYKKGTTYGCAWDTVKRSVLADIPAAQKASVVSAQAITSPNTTGSFRYGGNFMTGASTWMLRYLYLSTSCELN